LKKSNTRPETRETLPEARPTDRPVIYGRDGEVLSRRSSDMIDPQALPAEIVEAAKRDGFEYEWKNSMVLGRQVDSYVARMLDNGWRPVPASRMPGRFTSADSADCIQFEGQVLMERPASLCEQAREEDRKKAISQMAMTERRWGVETRDPSVFATNSPNTEQDTFLRKTVEATPASWKPALSTDAD